MSKHPAIALRGLKSYSDQLLNSFLEIQESVSVLKSALAETVPGFSASYEKHLANLRKEIAKHPTRGAAISQLRRDLEELSQVIRELYERH